MNKIIKIPDLLFNIISYSKDIQDWLNFMCVCKPILRCVYRKFCLHTFRFMILERALVPPCSTNNERYRCFSNKEKHRDPKGALCVFTDEVITECYPLFCMPNIFEVRGFFVPGIFVHKKCDTYNEKTYYMPEAKKPLRSARWFGPADLRSFGHRSRAMQMGYAPEEWQGKPVIAIINTWSDLQPCHTHFKQRVEDVKRGILMAGGFPVELPALSVSESFVKPTTMMYRNMLAMETEELLRSHPVDGAVLMGGCDKTTPGLLLGAHQHEHPGDLPARRPDAARQLAGQSPRLRLRQLEILGRTARRQDHRAGLARRRAAASRAATAPA